MSFEFQLSDGTRVKTGNKQPATRPLAFSHYPESDLLPLEQIVEILQNPNRRPSRQLFGDDWILYQGNRNSCNAYAVSGALERTRLLNGHDRVRLAPESLYALINDGVDEGSFLNDGMREVCKSGIAPREMVDFEAYLPSQISIEAKRAALSYRGFECYQFPTHSLEAFWHSMITAAARREMIVMALHVGDNFIQGRGGADSGNGNHAVGADDAVIVGTPRTIFDIQLDMFNSWNLQFGDRGRCLVNPRHIEMPMHYHGMYAIRSCLSDPNADNPFVLNQSA